MVPDEGVNLFPVPVAETLTGTPARTFPLESRAVTVTVAVAPPAALAGIVAGVAVTVDWPADTPPAVIENVSLTIKSRPAVAALSEYPAAARLMVSVANVATPAAACTVATPPSVPPAGLAAIPTVTLPEKPLATFPEES